MKRTQIVEATLFASDAPLHSSEIARADHDLTPSQVEEAIGTLRREYEESERSFQIYQLGDGYQILTRPEFAPYLERFDSVPKSPTLSEAALETLAIVAYRQPIDRIEIEEIRGVGSSSVLRTLQEWELIDVVGRGEGLGRPLLYGTTDHFLQHFGFQTLEDLPRPEELPVTLREELAEGEDGADGTADGDGEEADGDREEADPSEAEAAEEDPGRGDGGEE